MEASTTQEPTLLYKFYRLLIIPALLWYVWLAYLSLTTPQGVTVVYAEWGRLFGIFVGVPVTIIVGFAIMRYRPDNIIGPVMIVGAALGIAEPIKTLQLSAQQLVLNNLGLWIFLCSNAIVVAHFPSGKIHPSWAKPFVYVLVVGGVVTAIISTFGSSIAYGSDLAYTEPLANPFLLNFLAPISDEIYRADLVIAALITIGMILIFIIRYITTTRLERKQLQWAIVGSVLPGISPLLQIFLNLRDEALFVTSTSIAISSVALPITIGIAILFYNLWDITVIIRRTLIYAVVSALLALTYFTIVLTAQTFLSGFIPEDNTLLIVVSTLVIAALFNPILQRVQRVIDRLFYRKRYDTEATLEQFSEKIRDAMDAQAIEQHIVDTVTSTIQPETISLWVVEPSQNSQV